MLKGKNKHLFELLAVFVKNMDIQAHEAQKKPII